MTVAATVQANRAQLVAGIEQKAAEIDRLTGEWLFAPAGSEDQKRLRARITLAEGEIADDRALLARLDADTLPVLRAEAAELLGPLELVARDHGRQQRDDLKALAAAIEKHVLPIARRMDATLGADHLNSREIERIAGRARLDVGVPATMPTVPAATITDILAQIEYCLDMLSRLDRA